MISHPIENFRESRIVPIALIECPHIFEEYCRPLCVQPPALDATNRSSTVPQGLSVASGGGSLIAARRCA